jgi:hypothetical protein
MQPARKPDRQEETGDAILKYIVQIKSEDGKRYQSTMWTDPFGEKPTPVSKRRAGEALACAHQRYPAETYRIHPVEAK